MKGNAGQFKANLDPRCKAILLAVRDTRALPSLNAALNFLIRDYYRLQEVEESNPGKRNHNGTNSEPKFDFG